MYFHTRENLLPSLPPKPMCHGAQYTQTVPPPSAVPSGVLSRVQAEEGTEAVKLNPTSSSPL